MAIASDDFSASIIDDVWDFSGPGGTRSALGRDDGEAFVTLSTGTGDHNVWNANRSARLLQDAADGDFEVSAKFLSTPSQKYQMQGLLVEQDADNWLRFDIYSNGSSLRAFAAVTVDGRSSRKFDVGVGSDAVPYLSIERSGDSWTLSTSLDGSSWTRVGGFNHQMAVSAVGPFAGSTPGSGGFDAKVDYFENAADPIADEDGTVQGPQNAGPVGVDDAFRTEFDEPITFSRAELLANDRDDDGDALSIVAFGTPDSGTLADNGDTLTFTPAAGFSGTARFSYDVSDGTDTDTATVRILVDEADAPPPPPPPSSSSLASDDFSAAALGSGWSFAGPGGTSSALGRANGEAFLTLTTPEGNHDAWNANRTARVLQDAQDEDFSVTLRFLSTPSERYEMQGVLVEEDASNWLRFDTYSNGSSMRAFAGITVNGKTRKVFDVALNGDAVPYLTVERDGDVWTFSTSTDGVNFAVAGSFTHAMAVSAVGPFAGSTNGSGGFTAQVDYFESASDPIVGEDQNVSQNAAPSASDDVFRTGEDEAITIARADLLANDSDADGDALSVVGLGTARFGSIADNGDGTFDYTPAAGFVGTDSFDYTVSDGTDQDVGTVRIVMEGADQPNTGFDSDDFAAQSLDARWSFAGPSGTASALERAGDEAFVTLTTPAGDYNVWGSKRGARLMQDAADEDFSVTARFLSAPSEKYQMQGIIVEEDATNWLRFDTYSNGAGLRAFAAVTNDGRSTKKFDVGVAGGSAPYLSLTRDGDTWIFATSADGTNWTEAGRFNYALEVTAIGPFAGSTGGANGFAAKVDYFQNEAAPILAEDDFDGAPIAGPDTFAVEGGETLTFSQAQLLANDSDPDGDPVSFLRIGTPANGTLTDNGNGTYDYTAAANFSGADEVAYVITDGNQNVTGAITINVDGGGATNGAPVPVADRLGTAAETALVISIADLLANDSDPDGDTLSFAGFTQPTTGALVDNGDGTLTFTPAAGFSGDATFSYRVTDGTATRSANVTVDVGAADASGIASDDFSDDALHQRWEFAGASGSATLADDGTDAYLALTVPDGTFNLWNRDKSVPRIMQDAADEDFAIEARFLSEPDEGTEDQGLIVEADADTWLRFDVYHSGNGLKLFAATTDGGVSRGVFNNAVAPGAASHLKIEREGDLFTFYYSDDGSDWQVAGSKSFALAVSSVGVYAGSLGASPGYVGKVDYFFNSAAPIVSEDDGPEAPIAADDVVLLDTSAGRSRTISHTNLLQNDSDPNGDTLTVASVGAAANGTVVDNANGSLTYTADAGFSGVDRFTYRVTDGTESDTATVYVGVDNDAPTPAGDQISVNEDASTTVDLLANDTDPNGDPLSLVSVGDASHGTLVENANGTVTYTPDADYFGQDAFTYLVSDGVFTRQAVASVNVRARPDAPVAADDQLSTPPGTELRIALSQLLGNDRDPDGDDFALTSFTSPQHGTLVERADGSLSYTPNGSYTGIDSFSYTITDDTGRTSTAQVQLTVGDATINVWYGDVQEFGSPAEAQRYVNILGNVDLSEVASLSYSLNGGADRALSLGPDTRRLQKSGDFNADILYSDLDATAADDVVTLKTRLKDGGLVTRDVTIDYEAGDRWDPNYAIDWANVDDIQSVAQIVDGYWGHSAAGARLIEPGYDRFLAVGDEHYDNYELNLTITPHDLTSEDPRGRDGGVFGFGAIWGGHTDAPVAGRQPKSGWQPSEIVMYETDDNGNGRWYVFDRPGIDNMTLEEETTYNVTFRVEQPDPLSHTYKLKVWEVGEAEPTGWLVDRTYTYDDPMTGSLMLLSHYYDVTFGDLTVTEITGNDIIVAEAAGGILSGVDLAAALPGLGESDALIGGAGADVFLLGNNGVDYYDDGVAASEGRADYAYVSNFEQGADRIRLGGSAEDYMLAAATGSLPEGTAIWRADDDELIGVVADANGLALTNAYFQFDVGIA